MRVKFERGRTIPLDQITAGKALGWEELDVKQWYNGNL